MTRPRIGSSGHHFERIRNIAFGLHRDEVEGKFPTLTVEQLDILFNENPSPTWTNFDKQILNIIRKHCFEVFDLDPEQREEKSAIIQDLLENAAEIIPQPSTQEHYHQNPEHYYHKGKMILTNDGWRLLADAVEFRAPSNHEDELEDSDSHSRLKGNRWKTLEIRLGDFINKDLTCVIDGESWRLKLPPWQRPGGAWGKLGGKKEKELIDTVSRGLPLPPTFGWKRPNGELAIVDGQQRINAFWNSIEVWSGVNDDYQLVLYLLDEDLNWVDVRDLYERLNMSGKRLTSTELALLTFHLNPLNQLIVKEARDIINRCREGSQSGWEEYLVESVILRRGTLSDRRQELITSDIDSPLSRNEMAIYRVFMRIMAYSLRTDEGNEAHGKSTTRAAEYMFQRFDDPEDSPMSANDFLDKVKQGMEQTFLTLHRDAYTLPGRSHHEFAMTVQVSGIIPVLGLLTEDVRSNIRQRWTTFRGEFEDLRQNSQTIWKMHDDWDEQIAESVDNLRVGRLNEWELNIEPALKLANVSEEEIVRMRQTYLSG